MESNFLETTTFAELGLGAKLMAAIEAAGYTTPTPIQAAAIPVAVSGRDVLGIAQTGTGKTAGFTLPMIQRLETGRARARMPRSLILAPTRELAAQVEQSFDKYGVNHKLTVALLIGGVSMEDQVRKLDRGVDVLIATPGRLLDHFQRGRVMLMGVEILVIDEADRMLDMGFIPDIEKICKLLPPRRQTLFFSATMPPEITRLVSQFLKDPVRVEVARPATTAKTITQQFRFCGNGEDWAKREALRELIKGEDVRNAIIFCNRKRDVAVLFKSLTKHGFNAGALHGDMDQKARMETLDKFRSGEITFLAASDVAARGLDIPDVSHVFNFDLPWQSDDYVHRIGRTGRAGKEGHSTSIVTVEDLKSFKDIEKLLNEPAQWIGEPPTEEDFANAGKRRRGRGGRGAGRDGGRGEGRGAGDRRPGRDRSEAGGRPERTPRDEHHRPRRDRPERERPALAPAAEHEAGSTRPEPRARHDEQRDRQPRHERPDRAERPAKVERSERHGERGERGERPPRMEQAPREPRQKQGDASGVRPRRAEQQPVKPPREDAASSGSSGQQPQQQRSRRQGGGGEPHGPRAGAVGFADNVPAFLRNPPRPVKTATK